MFGAGFARTLPILALFGTGVVTAAAQEKIYWADPDDHGIFRADLDGSDVETVVSGNNCFSPIGLSLDAQRGELYWTGGVDCGESGILRATLDGSAVQQLPLEMTDPTGIAVGGDRIYWIDGASGAGMIHRAGLDGSAPEDLVATGLYAWDLVLDLDAGSIYWTELGAQRLRRADLDGSNPETLIADTLAIALALDRTRDRLYVAAPGLVFRTALDGTDPEPLVEDIGYPQGLALDLSREQMLWTTNLSGAGSKIRRARIDGPPIQDLIVDLDRPKGIALLLAQICGNGVVEPPEGCDDGNNVSGDGCTADCVPESGVPAVSFVGAALLALVLLATGGVAVSRRRTPAFRE